MNVLVAQDHEELSQLAADLIVATAARCDRALLGLGSGETPMRAYDLVAQRLLTGPVRPSRLRVLSLCEWVGVRPEDPASCEHHLRSHVLDPLGVTPDRFFGFDGGCSDYDAECARMRTVLEHEGPLDLVVLGLGVNGHLAWNEPGETLARTVHLSELTQTTQNHPMLGTAQHTPTFGLTLGIGDLLQARQLVLLVSGRHKAEQMRRLMGKDISTAFPASLLWTHSDAICICDREAHG